MTNKWKKTAAFALSLAIVAVNSANSWSNSITKAAETSSIAISSDTVADAAAKSKSAKADSVKEEKDESYYDAETQTLHLKGYLQNSEDGTGLVIPDGVDRWEIMNIVAEEGTVFPEDSSYLFGELAYIYTFDLKKADTSKVTNMSKMFWAVCSDELDLSGFDTINVTDMSDMFCMAYLPNLDLSGFDTSKVTNMTGMFEYTSFNTLDLTSFDTSNVTAMDNMFCGSYRLETIYVSDKWSVENVNIDQDDLYMFYDCQCLSGGKGTVFDPSVINSEYARIDGGEEAPGYLSAVGDKKDLCYFDKKTSTLHLKGYVKNSSFFEGLILPEGVNKEDVLHIVADEGVVLPSNSTGLFIGMENLETADLKKVASSTIIDMSCMFEGCVNLVSVDLSGLNTSRSQSMSYMFMDCAKLETLDLSSFDTSTVYDMSYMFEGCSSLASLDISSFDTSNVWYMSGMFVDCAFDSIDLSNFNTSNVYAMYDMFRGCKNLTYLDLSSFDTHCVYSMSNMFYGCSSLTYIDLSSLNTSSVFDMFGMFEGCASLETLDLSKFDTWNVNYMDSLFAGCSNLTTIYVGSRWSTLNVDRSMGVYDIFLGCDSLVGGAGTVYDPSKTSIDYARIDGGRFVPGYFTAEPEIVKNTVKDIANRVRNLIDKYRPYI